MAGDREVLSARNPRVQTLRRLSGRRSARAEAGRFVIEGPRLVREALDAGLDIDEVYLPIEAAEDAAVRDLLTACEAAGVAHLWLGSDTFSRAASTEHPQPAIAVARPPVATLDAVTATATALFVLVDVADPGNAGTLVRVAEAAGIGAVIACGDAVEWWNPKVVRASAGSLFRVPVVGGVDAATVLDLLAGRRVTTLATTLEAEVAHTEQDYRGPVAFVLGSEAHGLAPEVIDRCTRSVRIPMAGAVESLNVAMAGAVLAFELARQRGSAR